MHYTRRGTSTAETTARFAKPPMSLSLMGGSVTVFHVGSTADGEMIEMSANVSGPIMIRVDSCDTAPTKPLNTPTRLMLLLGCTDEMVAVV